MNSVRKNLVMSVLSGNLLSIPFLLPHTGLILLFAFVPLLWLEHAFTVNRLKDAGNIMH
jgi:ABC-type sulfate transport system permease component